MNKKTLLGAVVLSLFALASCSPKYTIQVYDVSSELQKSQNSLVYSNEDCELNYNLWSESGRMGFLITNKKDVDLYLVMPQSFFIRNGLAFDYYEEGSKTNTQTTNSSYFQTTNIAVSDYIQSTGKWTPSIVGYSYGSGHSNANSKSSTTVNPTVICIPANSSKFIQSFSISDYVYKDCDDYSQNYPSKQSRTIYYDKSNSPLVFRNRIAYTFDLKSNDVQFIDNEFYVSALTNYSQKYAIDHERMKTCESNFKKTVYYYKMTGASKFYNFFKTKSSSRSSQTSGPRKI